MYNKDLKSEAYLVRVGKQKQTDHGFQIAERKIRIEKALKISTEGYTTMRPRDIFKNRTFAVIEDDSFVGIITELVHPYKCIMPESFIADILDRFSSTESGMEEFGVERGKFITQLCEWEWNPSLALEKTFSSMLFHENDGSTHCISLPSFMWDFWKSYINQDYLSDQYNNLDTYCKWAKEFQENHPEFCLETWKNQKETIDQWQSIK